jgi:hypothetical protein
MLRFWQIHGKLFYRVVRDSPSNRIGGVTARNNVKLVMRVSGVFEAKGAGLLGLPRPRRLEEARGKLGRAKGLLPEHRNGIDPELR